MARNKHKRRCGARTTAGGLCKAWARRGSDPPRCTFHGKGSLPTPSDRARGRACSATTAGGKQCRNWAIHGRDVCSVHAGLNLPNESHRAQGRVCTARLSNGEQCTTWALRDSRRNTCSMHAGLGTTRAHHAHAGDRACSATTVDGKQCRNWAVRDPAPARRPATSTGRPGRSSGSARTAQPSAGRPFCRAHLPPTDPRRLQQTLPTPADRAQGRACTATTAGGEQCRNWATHDSRRNSCSSARAELPSQPPAGRQPLCWVHAFPHQHPLIRHGYYRRVPHFAPAEHAAIAHLVRHGRPLAAEIATLRLKLRDAFLYLGRPHLTGPQKERTARVIFRGALAVSRLVRAQNKLLEVDWQPQTAAGAGQLLQNILENEDARPRTPVSQSGEDHDPL